MKTIIVVEDNKAHAILTVEAFNEAFMDYKIIHFETGKKAIDFLFRRGEFVTRSSENPSLVLLDINMPELNGFEVLEIIKSSDNFRSIPVVMLSLSASRTDVDKCYELGVNAYVQKDIDLSSFMRSIKNIGEFWAFTTEPPSTIPTVVN